MNRSFPPFALVGALCACALAACSQNQPAPPSAQPVKPATTAAAADKGSSSDHSPAGDTRLTVYSGGYAALSDGGDGGYALVDSELRYDLDGGENRIIINHLPRAIDVAAVTLKPASPGIRVTGQRFVAPLSGNVLERALGREVAVEHTSGDAKQTDSGILVAADNGLTLALNDGRYKLIPEYDSLSVLDSSGLPAATPQLRWQILAQQAGTATFQLDYPTGGLAWRAEYLARLAAGESKAEQCTLSLNGWAMVANQSGVPFRDVALTLVAGEPERVPEASPRRYAMRAAMAPPPAADASGAGMPTQRASGEYHAYEMPERTTLANAAIERVPLFAPANTVSCTRIYETRPGTRVWIPRTPRIDSGFNNDDGKQPVKAVVNFSNSKDAGLGRPLPAGRMRVFEGADFLGESALDHTPQGADVRLEVGTAFDLTAERQRTSFSVDRKARMVRESFAIELGNAKDEDATIRVVEPMPRWRNWKIIDSSLPATKRDAQHASFDVPVPANDATTRLTYTVLYRWDEDVHP